MPHIRSSSRFFESLLLSSLVGLHVTLAVSQNACDFQLPVLQTVIHQQVVSVNTDVLTNTSFYPIPEAAITVMNAPTSFDIVTMMSWSRILTDAATMPTLTSPLTVTSSISAGPSPTETDSSFVLIIQGLDRNHKRQSSSFVGADGSATTNCSDVPIYTITNGVLTATIDDIVYYYSTDSTVACAPFVPSTTPGSIDTYFAAASNGYLTWTNSQFWNGQAQFCAVSNGTVYAVFQEDEEPQGCSFIQLSLYSSSCAAAPGNTGPSGPSVRFLINT